MFLIVCKRLCSTLHSLFHEILVNFLWNSASGFHWNAWISIISVRCSCARSADSHCYNVQCCHTKSILTYKLLTAGKFVSVYSMSIAMCGIAQRVVGSRSASTEAPGTVDVPWTKTIGTSLCIIDCGSMDWFGTATDNQVRRRFLSQAKYGPLISSSPGALIPK